MITNNLNYKKFKDTESYSLPFTELSLDRAALVAALLILQELKSNSFGLDLGDLGFQGVVPIKSILGIEEKIKEQLSDLGIDPFLK